MADSNTAEAVSLMLDFAGRSGLDSARPRQRYLWTDAFAVCNFLGLARATGDPHYRDLALRLVDQVHHTLGRHRHDDPRRGWISGLGEREGAAHPTRGGLRIGKPLPERGPDEPFDERLEWERDGQYFHYLSKWMHALDQVSRATGEPHFNAWARELAVTAYDTFTYRSFAVGTSRMYWKMSTDLSRPLVPSMGQHDPLDGYVTAMELQATAAGFGQSAEGPDLAGVIREFAAMAEQGEWTSPDPLGIGGLLVDAYRVAQLIGQGVEVDEHPLERLLRAALTGLQYYAASGELRAPAEHRLAFRELGLAIGLQALERMAKDAAQGRIAFGPKVRAQLGALMPYLSLGEEIEAFWRNSANRGTSTWSEHRDINEVMLATRLVPVGFLALLSDEESRPEGQSP